MKIFSISLLMVTILVFTDAVDFWYSRVNYPIALRYFTCATGYSLRPMPVIMLAMLIKGFKNIKSMFIYIPCVLNTIIAYTSIFTKWMFYFDEKNEFYRGSMGALPFVTCALYMLILIYNSVKKYKMGNKREASIIFLIALMSTLAVCMESIFKFEFIINGVGGISIVFCYLFMHTQTYKRDPLTNVLNRRAFYLDAQIYSKTSMIIVSVDLNNLKLLNDEYGHSVGDKAIITSADCIEKHLINGYKLYRIGGDEFMLLCPKADKHEVQQMMEAAQKDIAREGYIVAWGMCEYKENMDFEKTCSVSDSLMYEHKMKLKERQGYYGKAGFKK
ncbi:GGDEF domain-containing protein [uncultured Clostridium sp.]|uniref:GGDEF domain-containing protein n=1 Tax=uncultured Clostridium sp. TaxID=59620 RepID=UPI0025E161DB|nr:GGDEF domain-containing protein [uncultured Clostridium sp.]